MLDPVDAPSKALSKVEISSPRWCSSAIVGTGSLPVQCCQCQSLAKLAGVRELRSSSRPASQVGAALAVSKRCNMTHTLSELLSQSYGPLDDLCTSRAPRNSCFLAVQVLPSRSDIKLCMILPYKELRVCRGQDHKAKCGCS